MGNLEFYSNGKLLITGEYFVLKGARGLALPLKKGQKMTIEYFNESVGRIYWNSYYNQELWFWSVFDRETLDIVETNNSLKARFIQKLLQQTALLNKKIVNAPSSVNISTTLEFHPEWGLGSSSSLISNLAYWTKTDPYLLHKNSTGGSGYDIACARAQGPIVYSVVNNKPEIIPVQFKPGFSEYIFFVYLGNKVNSAESISKSWNVLNQQKDIVAKITEITEKIVAANSITDFERLVYEHEEIIASALNKKPVKQLLFTDYHESIKSLGAWGGDFMMVTSEKGKRAVERYFNRKGLTIIFNFNDLVL